MTLFIIFLIGILGFAIGVIVTLKGTRAEWGMTTILLSVIVVLGAPLTGVIIDTNTARNFDYKHKSFAVAEVDAGHLTIRNAQIKHVTCDADTPKIMEYHFTIKKSSFLLLNNRDHTVIEVCDSTKE